MRRVAKTRAVRPQHVLLPAETALIRWIRATLGQIGPLAVDPIAHPKPAASFSDPNCPVCATTIQPEADPNGVYPGVPVQAPRTIPIPADKQAQNAQAAAAVGKVRWSGPVAHEDVSNWIEPPNAAPLRA
jgi:hypothetical protein